MPELSCVLLVNTYRRVVWLACTTTGIQIIVMLFAFTVFSLSTKPERSAEQLLAADLSYGCIPANSHRSLHAFRTPWPYSILPPEVLSRASSASGSFCPCCWRWQITDHKEYELYHRSHYNARTEPGYKLNCTRRGTVGGVRDFPCALTTQFTVL